MGDLIGDQKARMTEICLRCGNDAQVYDREHEAAAPMNNPHCYCTAVESFGLGYDWEHKCCFCGKQVPGHDKETRDPAHGQFASALYETTEPPVEACPAREPTTDEAVGEIPAAELAVPAAVLHPGDADVLARQLLEARALLAEVVKEIDGAECYGEDASPGCCGCLPDGLNDDSPGSLWTRIGAAIALGDPPG